MLISQNWMKATWQSILSWILNLTEGISAGSIASALTCHPLVLAGCLLAGLGLCLLGFRCHKLVLGCICSVLLGWLGWYIGSGVNVGNISVPAIYGALLAITGFFAGYLLYFLAVFSGGWFFFLAVLAPLSGLLQGHVLWIGALLSAAYSAFYIKYKLVMSAVTGALALGLLAYALSPLFGLAAVCACTAGGIRHQLWQRKRYDAKTAREAREQLEKYPYGPGQAYGWQEPQRKV